MPIGACVHRPCLGNDVALIGFDLRHPDMVVVCQQGKRRARVTLDSIEFPELSPV